MADWTLPRRKRPTETFRLGVDFKGDIEVGDSIASHNATAVDDLGADVTGTFLGARTLTGTVLKVVVLDGTDGRDVTVTLQVTTVAGDVFQATVLVPVRA